MGEIGINHHTALHELKLWQILSIISGYRKRDRTLWEASRMQTFFILSSLGCDIKKPDDLIRFPWESEQQEISDEEIEDLKNLIRQENENRKNR